MPPANSLWLKAAATLLPCPRSTIQGPELRPHTVFMDTGGMRVTASAVGACGVQRAWGRSLSLPFDALLLPLPLALPAGVPKGLFLKVRSHPVSLLLGSLPWTWSQPERPDAEWKGGLGLGTAGAKVWE